MGRSQRQKLMFKFSMHAVHTSLRRLMRDEAGTTAIEYALIASGVSIVILATVVSLGSNVQGMFNSVSTALK